MWMMVGVVALTWNFFGIVDKQDVRVEFKTETECSTAAAKVKATNHMSTAYCIQMRADR